MLLAEAYCIYFERKISAWIQDRRGPNRVGPWGLFQSFADGAKFLLKEDIIPGNVDRPLFLFAPAVMMLVSLIGFAVIPWGGQVDLTGDGKPDVVCQVANPDIGLLYILGVGSMGVYGIVLGGWASNNKYSFYGAMRAAAQMLSYEIPMGLAIVVIVLSTGRLRLEEIVLGQTTGPWNWNVFYHPLAFVLLFITALAESNRAPFDLAEAEQELVGGYHTEYSALKFGMFFLAEYGHMVTSAAFMSVLFLGGWHLPLVPACQPEAVSFGAMAVKMLVLSMKIAAFLFVFMWVRWTVPRFRFDQLMRLAWRGLVPMGMGLALLATVLVLLGWQDSMIASLAGNAVVAAVTVMIASRFGGPVTGRQGNLPPVRTAAATSG